MRLESQTHTVTHCKTLQHTATHCNTLQHTATHCNTLQHTATQVLGAFSYSQPSHMRLEPQTHPTFHGKLPSAGMQADTQETLVYGVLGAIHLGTSGMLVQTLQHNLQHMCCTATHAGGCSSWHFWCVNILMYLYMHTDYSQAVRAGSTGCEESSWRSDTTIRCPSKCLSDVTHLNVLQLLRACMYV